MWGWGRLKDSPERVEICRAVTVRLLEIARNMPWYVPRRLLRGLWKVFHKVTYVKRT